MYHHFPEKTSRFIGYLQTTWTPLYELINSGPIQTYPPFINHPSILDSW